MNAIWHFATSVTLTLAVPVVGFAQGKQPIRASFLGVWNLVSCERRAGGQVTYPYGEKPVGRITYDKAGRMSALLMNPDRPRTSYTADSGGIARASEADVRSVVSGFVAYHGTFDVDESKEVVIHHVKAAMHPAWVGTDLVRSYEFSGNRMTLTAASEASKTVLVWEREPD
jgi:hypothetical protein